MSQNFKAVVQLQAELHLLKVEKLDACIRPLFANPVTYLFHVLTIKQAIESISGYWNTSSGQSGSDVTRCTDSTEKMGKMLILC